MKYSPQQIKSFLDAKKMLKQKEQDLNFSSQPEDALEILPTTPENLQKLNIGNQKIPTPLKLPLKLHRFAIDQSKMWDNPLIKEDSPGLYTYLQPENTDPAITPEVRLVEGIDLESHITLPISGAEILEKYPSLLTDYEKTEILDYEEVYYLGELSKKIIGNFRNNEGVYKGTYGDHLAYRFEILDNLGQGTFGKVYKCLDRKHDLKVAIKVLHKSCRMKKLASNEIQAHELIRKSDPDDSKCIVQMLQCFDFRGHICLVFELLSYDLYHYMKINRFEGLSSNVVKRIGLQILVALKHIHSLGIIHRDLKLENVLFKQANKSSIKIVDFGSCALFPSPFVSYIQSRYYRAPEVLMSCGHDKKIDIWSFGCMVFELYKGRSLFLGNDANDQILKIASVLGPPPISLLDKSQKPQEFFDEIGVFSIRVKTGLKELVGDDEGFYDFVKKCLEWDPEARISADEALKHPWIVNQSRQQARKF